MSLSEKLRWPGSPESFRQSLAAGLLLAGASAVWSLRDRLTPWQQLGLWALVPLGLVLLFRQSLRNALGPLFFYDLIRTSRRARHVVLRCVYAAVLLLWFFVFYSVWFAQQGHGWDDLFQPGRIAIREIPRFARSFFLTFLAVQYAAVLLLTPVYVAGAITEERECGTLRLLLSTELTSREIVLGKLVSRLANLALLLAAGLPILSVIQFLGGVDPNQVLLGFAATGATMFSLGAMSLYVSIFAHRPPDAVFRAYLWAGVFLSVGAFAPPFCCGNPFTILFLYGNPSFPPLNNAGAARNPEVLLGVGTVGYILFHLAAAVAWCYLSIRTIDRLRSADAAQTRPPTVAPDPSIEGSASPGAPWSDPPAEPAPVLSHRPPLVGEPLVWRELNFGQEFRFQRLHIGMLIVLFLAGLALFLIFLTIFSDSLRTGMTAERVNVLWVKPAGTSLACLMFLLIAFFAASSVTREREWETLDSLLATPVERHSILFAKWLGSLWGVRQLWWWLGGVWLIGVLTGGLNVLAVPLLLAAWTVFAVFVASLGVFLSIVCRTSQRATIAVLLVCGLLAVGPWLLAGNGLLVGTPPAILLTLAFSYRNVDWYEVLAALAWLVFYAAAGWGLWTLSLSWFDPPRKR